MRYNVSPENVLVATISMSDNGTWIARVYSLDGTLFGDPTAPSLVQLVTLLMSGDFTMTLID